ncbi:MAG: phosphosulfolactate synthase [Firmicutes bacterium]|nr:phosphosulfolactate synthase [Bacillota bacterium]
MRAGRGGGVEANRLCGAVFCPVPGRETKPRTRGLTMVIDKGLGPAETRDWLELVAEHIDFVKLAFGTSLLYPPRALAEKIRAIRDAGVDVYPGGTLLEVAVHQGTAAEFLDAAAELGFSFIEVSEGTIDLAPDQRKALMRRARAMGFGVLSEVGKKDPQRPLHPARVAEQVEEDLAEGAFKVIVEGRDSGRDVGIFGPRGEVRESLLEAIVARIPSLDGVMWEAPKPAQQQALLAKLGPNVSLGNVQPPDVLTLEAMRRGLRGDTWRRVLEFERARPDATEAAGHRNSPR